MLYFCCPGGRAEDQRLTIIAGWTGPLPPGSLSDSPAPY